MQIDTFAHRLKIAMNEAGLKQSDLVTKTGIDKTLISKYLAGASKARQDKLTLLAKALNTNEVWLMGYDVPMSKFNSKIKQEDVNDINVIINNPNFKKIYDDERFTVLVKNKDGNVSEEAKSLAMGELYKYISSLENNDKK